MSHVDEGTLHAYLDAGAPDAGADGAWQDVAAHLAECVECRARLEEAGAVRARAAAILDTAGPAEIRMPPFDEIRDRARGGPSRRGGPARYRALAWAATVVLAAGVGWYAGFMARAEAPGAESAIAARRDVAAAPSPAADLPAPRPAGEEARTGFARAQRRDEPGRAGQREADAATGARPPADQAPATPAPAARPSLAQAAERKAAAEHPDTVQRDSVRRFPAEGAIHLEEVVVSGLAADADSITGADAGGRPAWRPVNADAAQRFLGAPVRTVADLPALSYEVAVVEGAPAVRVVQQIGPGTLLELIHRREVAMADEARAAAVPQPPAARGRALAGDAAVAPDTVPIAWIVVDGVRIRARATVAPDSLRALLAKVRE